MAVYLTRGEVYLPLVVLPEPDGELVQRRKFVVILRGDEGFPPSREYAFVVLSTYRGKKQRSFEVLVDPAKHDDLPARLTNDVGVIDGRWVRTAHKETLEGVPCIGFLPERIMTEIDYAIAIGLGM